MQQNNSSSVKSLTHKPLAIVNIKGEIEYANYSFTEDFGLKNGSLISELQTEPLLLKVLEKLSTIDYPSLETDFLVTRSLSSSEQVFSVYIEKIEIKQSLLYSLTFTSNQVAQSLDQKITDLNYAIDFGGLAVIICKEDGQVRYSSKSFEEILSKSIEHIFAKQLFEVLDKVISPDDLILLKEAISQKRNWKKVVQLTKENGDAQYLEFNLIPLASRHVNSGSFIMTAVDITNYILRNKIIEQAEQRQRLIIDNISDLLIIVKKDNDKLLFENANDNFFKIFDLNRETAADKTLEEIIPEELYDILQEKISFNKDNKHIDDFQFSDYFSKREYLIKFSSTIDVLDKNNIFIISLSDITDRIHYEKELKNAFEKENKLNRMKDAFIANMSHEIRTPATAIIGYSNFLQEDIEAENFESVKEISELLKEGVTRLTNLLNKILDISMLQSGTAEIEVDRCSVSDIIGKVKAKYEDEAARSEIKIFLEQDNHSLFFYTDKQILQKAIDLIVDNSVKYNVKGGMIKLSVQKNYDRILISITDTGRGIEENRLDEILNPFVQEELEGHKRNYEGAGLGLTLAQKLIQALHGSLTIDSIKGVGTQVQILLPERIN